MPMGAGNRPHIRPENDMAYCTVKDIENNLSKSTLAQLTDDDSGTAQSDVIINACVADAGSFIDSYLVTRYVTPVSPVPEAVRAAAVSIAKYRLFIRREWALSDDIKYEYEEARNWLIAIASGKADIPTATTTVSTASGHFEADTRLFTTDTMNGF